MNTIRILIADDHELVRLGVRRVLAECRPDWEIVADAASGPEAIEKGEALRPDVAIVDLNMPGCDGVEVTRRLVEAVASIHILVLTMYMAAPILNRLRAAGARAYISKTEVPGKLVAAVERVLHGDTFLASSSAHRPAQELKPPDYVPAPFLLTPRELSVFRLLVQGRSNKELASDLHMSVRTVEAHRAAILARLSVKSVGELVRIAIRDGVV